MKRSIENDCNIQDCQQKKRVTEEREKQNNAMDGLIPEANVLYALTFLGEMSMVAKMVTFCAMVKKQSCVSHLSGD